MNRNIAFGTSVIVTVSGVFSLGNSINVCANKEFLNSKLLKCLIKSVKETELSSVKGKSIINATDYLLKVEDLYLDNANSEDSIDWCGYYAYYISKNCLVKDSSKHDKIIQEYVKMVENGELGKIAVCLAYAMKTSKKIGSKPRLDFFYDDLIKAILKSNLSTSIEKYIKTEDFFSRMKSFFFKTTEDAVKASEIFKEVLSANSSKDLLPENINSSDFAKEFHKYWPVVKCLNYYLNSNSLGVVTKFDEIYTTFSGLSNMY